MPGVHDALLVGYEVDGRARRVVLHTERGEGGQPPEKMDVVFSGVEAYAFRHDCLVNILFELREEPMMAAVDAHLSELDAGHRASGWPRFGQGDNAKTRERIAALDASGARWFELTASYGIEGWVLCTTVEYVAR